jgi:T5SS/PEP-CTERM-associated repeat protein
VFRNRLVDAMTSNVISLTFLDNKPTRIALGEINRQSELDLVRTAFSCFALLVKSAALVFGAMLAQSLPLHGQLVADGATRILDGTQTNFPGTILVGSNAPFTTLILTNGAQVTNGGLAEIGLNVSSRSNVVVVTGPGSSLTNGFSIYVGYSGSFNRLMVANGGSVVTPYGYLGFNTPFDPPGSSNNCAIVTGQGSLWDSGHFLYPGFSSQVIVSNGGRLTAETATLDRNSSTVTVTGPGSLWTSSGSLDIGSAAAFNRLIVSNGATAGDFSGSVGTQAGRNNVGIVTGAGSRWTNNFLFVGYWGGSSNRLIISDGGTVSGQCVVGSGFPQFASFNAVTVTDPGSQLVVAPAGSMTVGQQGAFNQLIVINGATVSDYSGYIGDGTWNSTGNVVVVTGAGSVWTNSAQLQVGSYGSRNQLVVSNGGTVFAESIYISVGTASNNSVVLDGGNLLATNVSAGISVQNGTLTLNSGVVDAYGFYLASTQAQFVFNGGSFRSRGTTFGNGSPFAIGNGASPAAFELLSNGSHTFSNGVVISRGAVLRGNGTILANVTNLSGGTLSPGSSIGQLLIRSNLVLAAGSTTIFELNKAAATNDNISGAKSVTFGGFLTVTNLSGPLANGDSFRLFAATNYSGSFGGLVAAPPGPGLWWDLSRLSIDGTLGVVTATNSRPGIRSAALFNATNLVLNATGLPYEEVYVLISTNLALTMPNWARLSTNFFDGAGNGLLTNAIAPGEPWRFFRLATD